MLPALRPLVEAIILYDADRAPERVTVAGAAVGVSRGLRGDDATDVLEALRLAIGLRVWKAGALELVPAGLLAAALVVQEGAAGLSTILVCGSELVGAEEPAAAESRALSMRSVLVSELQRALAGDEPPATVRRSVPASAMEAR